MHGILSACIINPSNLSSILSHKINTDWMRLRFIVSIPVVVVVVDLDDVGVAVAVHVYSCIVFFLVGFGCCCCSLVLCVFRSRFSVYSSFRGDGLRRNVNQ